MIGQTLLFMSVALGMPLPAHADEPPQTAACVDDVAKLDKECKDLEIQLKPCEEERHGNDSSCATLREKLKECVAENDEKLEQCHRNLRTAAAQGNSIARYGLARLICMGRINPRLEGSMELLDSSAAVVLRELLQGPPENWDHMLAFYFGDIYDAKMADWIVYVDSDGKAQQALFGDRTACKGDSVNRLQGENQIWAMVFSEKLQKPAARVTLMRLERYRGPGERIFDAFAKSYAVLFDKQKAFEAAQKVSTEEADLSTTAPLRFINLTKSDKEGERLFYGYARLPLLPNTRNRITLSPPGEESVLTDTNLRSVTKNFVNGEAGHLGLSVSLGGTINRINSARTHEDDLHPNLFLAADYTFGIKSAFNPWCDWGNVSIFGGTNIQGTVFEEFIFGLSHRKFFGLLGLGAGISISEVEAGTSQGSRTHWEPRPFVGFFYPL